MKSEFAILGLVNNVDWIKYLWVILRKSWNVRIEIGCAGLEPIVSDVVDQIVFVGDQI